MSALGDRIVENGLCGARGFATESGCSRRAGHDGKHGYSDGSGKQDDGVRVKITTEMLDKFNAGHNFVAVTRLRELLEPVAREPIELHIYELAELRDLRQRVTMLTEKADAIEARGPMPAKGIAPDQE